MKWKNIDIGEAYYYITGTFTEWLPLFNRIDVLEIVYEEITRSLSECNAGLAAYVLMPHHLLLLVHLPDHGILHRFCKNWRGRSAIRIIRVLQAESDTTTLATMIIHASGASRYAVWKEQVRALAIYGEEKLNAKVNYINENPVRGGLVEDPCEWQFSSYSFYERRTPGVLAVTPPVV